jgi:hypothetical protein
MVKCRKCGKGFCAGRGRVDYVKEEKYQTKYCAKLIAKGWGPPGLILVGPESTSSRG